MLNHPAPVTMHWYVNHRRTNGGQRGADWYLGACSETPERGTGAADSTRDPDGALMVLLGCLLQLNSVDFGAARR